jgi:hypothetical protein
MTLHLRYLAVSISLCLASPAEAFFGWGRKPAAPAPIGAVVVELTGTVEYQPADADAWEPARLQQTLEQGDMLMTDLSGSAVILFLDGSKIRISKNAAFVMEKQNEREVKLEVKFGVFEAWVKKLTSRRWKVRTPSAVAAIRGTDFVIRLTSPDGSTQDFSTLQQLVESNQPIPVDATFELFTGAIDVSDGFGNQTALAPGQQLSADANTGISQSEPKAMPAGKKMASKPKSQGAAKKRAAEAKANAKKAKKKAADAKKKAEKSGSEADQKAAEEAQQEADKAELIEKIAEEIVELEQLSETPDATTPTQQTQQGQAGEESGEESGDEGETGSDGENPAATEKIEEDSGIQQDVSPSSP